MDKGSVEYAAMNNSSISVVIPSLNEDRETLSRVVDLLSSDPSVEEVIVVDDCSSTPLSLGNARVVRNSCRLGSAASRAAGIALAKSPVVLTTDAHVRFKTKGWGTQIADAIAANPKGIVCPSCLPVGDCSFRGKLYGGHLDSFSSRRGCPVVLESRWNSETTANGMVGCAMGGAYAFDASWNRKIGGYSGIKGCDPIELVSLSLKTRLSGGSIVVLPDIEMEHSFRKKPPFDVGCSRTAYNKMRLSFVAFPPEVSTIVPTLLVGSDGSVEAISEFMSDFGEIVSERDSFWGACGVDQEEAIKRAGIEFNIDIKARRVAT